MFDELGERRLERSRACFVGAIDDVGSSLASSAQLGRVELAGVGDFPSFWWFSTKKEVVGRDSKMACDNVLFSCPLLAGP